jgi:hypothetical protein
MTVAANSAGPAIAGGLLSSSELRRLSLAARLPLAWTASARRRRLLLLGLAAPGFLLVALTPWHQVLGLLVLGAVLFAAALVFRRGTEPVFVRAEAAELWPPPTTPPWRRPHA